MIQDKKNFKINLKKQYPNLSIASKLKVNQNNFLDLNSNVEELNAQISTTKQDIKDLKNLVEEYKDEFQKQFKSDVTFLFDIKSQKKSFQIIYQNMSYPIVVNYHYYSKDNKINFDIPTPSSIENFEEFDNDYNLFKQDLDIYKNYSEFSDFVDNIYYILEAIKRLQDLQTQYTLNKNLINNKEKLKLKHLKSLFKEHSFSSIKDYVYFRQPLLKDNHKFNFISYYFDREHIRFITHTLKVKRDLPNNELSYNLNGKKVNPDMPISVIKFDDEFIYDKNKLNRLGFQLSQSGRMSYQFFLNKFNKHIVKQNISDF